MSGQAISTQATNATRAELIAAERRARHFWVALIVGLLSLQVAGGITSVFLALGDPSSAVVPNYHQSALNWDTTRRARLLTQELDWQVKTSVSEVTNEVAGGATQRIVKVTILDRQGQPVEGVSVTARVYHHARGNNVYNIRLAEDNSRGYQGSIGLTQPGIWQMDLQIEGEHGIAADSSEILVK